MPMNCSGRSVDDASRVIEIDDVFDATIADFFSDGHSPAKILRLTLSSSVAASITRSQSLSSANDGAKPIRFSAPLAMASVTRPRVTCRIWF